MENVSLWKRVLCELYFLIILPHCSIGNVVLDLARGYQNFLIGIFGSGLVEHASIIAQTMRRKIDSLLQIASVHVVYPIYKPNGIISTKGN